MKMSRAQFEEHQRRLALIPVASGFNGVARMSRAPKVHDDARYLVRRPKKPLRTAPPPSYASVALMTGYTMAQVVFALDRSRRRCAELGDFSDGNKLNQFGLMLPAGTPHHTAKKPKHRPGRQARRRAREAAKAERRRQMRRNKELAANLAKTVASLAGAPA